MTAFAPMQAALADYAECSIVAPSPITAIAAMLAVASILRTRTDGSTWITPGLTIRQGVEQGRNPGKIGVGLSEMMRGRSVASASASPRITAPALVPASCVRYLLLVRKLM